MSDTRRQIAERTLAGLHRAVHIEDTLGMMSRGLSEYATAVLEEAIAKLDAVIASFHSRNEPTGMLEMARNSLVKRASQERER